jgi:hypothetical protein
MDSHFRWLMLTVPGTNLEAPLTPGRDLSSYRSSNASSNVSVMDLTNRGLASAVQALAIGSLVEVFKTSCRKPLSVPAQVSVRLAIRLAPSNQKSDKSKAGKGLVA